MPVLMATNVLVEALPKSVKLVLVGVELPAGMLLLLPLTDKDEAIVAGVVDPLITAPGLTQLETDPVKAKLVSVPVLAPAASISAVTAVLLPEGMPWLK